jgi:hypothetical protein
MRNFLEAGELVRVERFVKPIFLSERKCQMSKKIRGRGRPVKCNPNTRRHVAKLVKENGLTKAKSMLADEGLILTLPTIRKYATAGGVGALKRGRPAVEKTEAPAAETKAA